jgi:predicted  nucleic acid-binding Zn-ribbon protein
MPHQCTECGYTFPDGSKEMLSGCPECGGNKFQYHPGSAPEEPAEESPPERPDAGVSGAVGKAADTVRDVFGGEAERSEPPEGTAEKPDAEPGAEADADADAVSPDEKKGVEDRAQADARSEVVDADDLPDPPASGAEEPAEETPAEPAEDESGDNPPELSELRQELNSQFESIRIVEPGQYELNLMELYDRDQYIIALQEDGRYVIEVPEAWREE